MLIMLMGFSLVLISLGVMGMYLLNILNQSKTLPQYVVRREEHGNTESENLTA